MKQEDYVTLEVAKLLKEKGYNEPSKYYYRKDNGQFMKTDGYLCNCYNYNVVECTANPLAEAAKWLREKFCIHVNTFPIYDKAYEIVDYKVRITTYDDLLEGKKGKLLSPPIWFEKYEQALNEGIKEALKLI